MAAAEVASGHAEAEENRAQNRAVFAEACRVVGGYQPANKKPSEPSQGPAS